MLLLEEPALSLDMRPTLTNSHLFPEHGYPAASQTSPAGKSTGIIMSKNGIHGFSFQNYTSSIGEWVPASIHLPKPEA